MKEIFQKVIQYIFESLVFACVIFFLAEFVKTGIVTNYISYNFLLTVTVIFGMMVLAFKEANGVVKKRRFRWFWFIIKIIISVGVGCILLAAVSMALEPNDIVQLPEMAYDLIPWMIGAGGTLGTYCILKNNK